MKVLFTCKVVHVSPKGATEAGWQSVLLSGDLTPGQHIRMPLTWFSQSRTGDRGSSQWGLEAEQVGFHPEKQTTLGTCANA